MISLVRASRIVGVPLLELMSWPSDLLETALIVHDFDARVASGASSIGYGKDDFAAEVKRRGG